MTSPRSASVVVVGAGMSGLVAAQELHRHGVDVLVVESADRVGGRVLAETSALGSRLDLGGQWVGRGHHRFEALAAELGATVFPMYSPRQPDVVLGPRRLSALSPSMLEAALTMLRWEAGVRRRTNPRAWSQGTMQDWIGAHVRTDDARRALAVLVASFACADPADLSMAFFGDMVRYQGGLATMLKSRGGAQDSLVVEGAGMLAERLAAELGERVLLDHRVTRIEHVQAGVTLRTSQGDLSAARVIVTVPPPMAASITFDPPLPDQRRRLMAETRMGSVYKAIAVYERPFWRGTRTHAEMTVLDEPGVAVFDSSSPDGPGHLTFLVAGSDARQLDDLSPDDRRDLLCSRLVPHLGAEAARPAGWHDKSWHVDEHAGGGYSALPKPDARGVVYPFPAEPVGPIHWAGTETASEHAGYIEGAIESGQRVAGQLVSGLS